MKTTFTKKWQISFITFVIIICCSAFTPKEKTIPIIGNGKILKENRKGENFTAISVKNGIDIYLTQGNEEKITVEAEENLIAHIITEVENNTLNIFTDKPLKPTKPIKVNIIFKTLKQLEASGGSDVYAKQIINQEDFKVKVSGGSDILLTIKTANLFLEASSGSDAQLFGFAENANLIASGGSDIKAGNFEITNCVLNVNGGSDAIIAVKEKLDGKATGGSDIIYSGNPGHVNVDVSGGSDCKKKK